MTRSRRTRLLAPLALLLPLATACDGGARSESEPPAVKAAGAEAPAPTDDSAATADAPIASRMVIRRATLQLRGDAPHDVVTRATRLTEKVGGFVAASDTQGVGSEIQQIDATLRVPSDRFEAVLSALRAEGELLHESLAGEDVTDHYTDLGAQLRSKRALEERLLSILTKVETVDDALSVEGQLTTVRTQIERLEGTKRQLEDRVGFATIELSVTAPVLHNVADAETVSSRLDRAVDDAGSAFIAVLGGLIRIFGVVLPLGLLGVPVALGVRVAWLRRRREQLALAQGLPPRV
ncbi:MAG: DUF4349 domain-containing protein [Myxococcota bacterium]